MDILISGIGVTGPTLAYWLLQHDASHRITLVERSPDLRASGQSIDIRQAAVDVIRRMGIIDKVKAHGTTEAGIDFVDESGKAFASFPASGNDEEQSFTSEYEILRGDLVKILYETVDGRVKTVFGAKVERYHERKEDGKVDVTLSNGAEAEYDVVIAADGQSSRIRNMALGTVDNPRAHYRAFNNYVAYYTMPAIPSLPGNFARWYNAPGGRAFMIRPDPNPKLCRANIIRQLWPGDTKTNERYREALAAGPEEYKRILREDYADISWAAKDILAGLDESDEFYASESAQVQAPTLAVGRIAFVGDAGYCPTPLTGMGTSLALIGAYILAGEIGSITHSSDVPSALSAYNDIMLPYSRRVQAIPLAVPRLLNPQTWLALRLVRAVVWFIYATGVVPLIGRIAGASSFSKKDFVLPEYTKKKE